MCFSGHIRKSPIVSLSIVAAISLFCLVCQPVLAVAGQDDAKASQAGQSNDTLQGNDTDQDNEQTDPAKQSNEEQGDSPLVDSPLDSAQPDVPKQVLPPWAKTEKRSDLPDLKDLTPRDLLVDVDQGELEHLYDYEAIEPDNLVLIKILYRLHQFSLEEVWHFVQQTKAVVPSAIAEDPQANRLNMIRLKGRVTKVERHDLLDRVAELYELVDSEGNPYNFDAYYRVHAVLEPGDRLATICVINVPEPWKAAAEIDEPFACSAMFLKVNSREEEPPDLLFAAYHMEWYPVSNALDAGLSAGELLLSKHGFDVSLLADAGARNRKSIDATDTPCFYQMLGTASKLSAKDFSGECSRLGFAGTDESRSQKSWARFSVASRHSPCDRSENRSGLLSAATGHRSLLPA